MLLNSGSQNKVLALFCILLLVGCDKTLFYDNSSREEAIYKDTFEYLCSPTLEGKAAGSNGSKLAAEFIISSIHNKSNIIREKFIHEGLELENILVSIPGDVDSTVIVGAHYDSYPSYNNVFLPGADDNVSGVSILINLVNQLSETKLKYNILFAFWDAEEIGRYGSKYYLSRTCDNILFYINLDTCGSSSTYKLGFLYDGEHPETVHLLDDLDTYNIFQVNEYVPTSYTTDCEFFKQYNLPFVSISPMTLPQYMHKGSDTPDIINYKRLYQINTIIHQMLMSL